MASDLLLGWIIGLITVIIPQLSFEIFKLRRRIAFLANPKPEQPLKKKGLFWWLRRK